MRHLYHADSAPSSTIFRLCINDRCRLLSLQHCRCNLHKQDVWWTRNLDSRILNFLLQSFCIMISAISWELPLKEFSSPFHWYHMGNISAALRIIASHRMDRYLIVLHTRLWSGFGHFRSLLRRFFYRVSSLSLPFAVVQRQRVFGNDTFFCFSWERWLARLRM